MFMKTVFYTRTAATALRRHSNRAKLIRAKINQYAKNPVAQANHVIALTGSDYLRLRVGDFRIVFAETDDTIIDIGPRGGIRN
jgi:mRNA interferase RelE/StbE